MIGGADHRVDPAVVAGSPYIAGIRIQSQVVGGAAPRGNLVESRLPGVGVDDHHGEGARIERVHERGAVAMLRRCVGAGGGIGLVGEEEPRDPPISRRPCEPRPHLRIRHLP